MKKLEMLIVTVLLFLFIIFLSSTVDATNITYKTEYYDSINTAVYVSGLDNLEEGYKYYIYITQDNTISPDKIISNAKMAKYDSLNYDETNNKFYIKTSSYFGVFEKAGDYYTYIAKGKIGHNDTFNFIDGPTKLERPALLPNGERIKADFNENGTSYYIKQYDYYTKMHQTERKVNCYLGKIEDETILTKLSDKTSDAYDKLYNYAKDNKNYVYTTSFDTTSTGRLDHNIWEGYTEFKEGEYYFVYFQLDTEDGTYIEVDDVQAYTVNNKGILGKFSTYVANNNKGEDISTENPEHTKDDTKQQASDTKTSTQEKDSIEKSDTNKTASVNTLPHAGIYTIKIISIILVVIGSGIFSFFKYNRLKNI